MKPPDAPSNRSEPVKTRISAITTAEIRQSFLDFFVSHDHRLVPSSPVIPYDDPTILFTNAGMNQFKDVFTGRRRVDFSRATSSQKCIRAGGKHNDLDNVGFTARHHTFFEMLGNFSFGDYFKEQAIQYAWEWVTKRLELPIDRLYATVYVDDDEAFSLWSAIAPELKNGRILRFGKKDNFWSMGEIGPCGPCSEIHFDRGEKYGTGPEAKVNGESDRFVEIWNLVFMQYDQIPGGEVVPLPKPSVDTGAGLERIAAIKQHCDTNYGIDLFQALIRAAEEILGSRYADNHSSHHVIVDHVRALTFAIADGAGISNEGQGYVLRRILRRAARHGRLLGAQQPFMYRLVPALVSEMGGAYPEIRDKQAHIVNIVRAEEESFDRTLATGLELFARLARQAHGNVIPGDEVFRLYDTYGFPYDLTEILAAEKGLTLDQAGFDAAMSRQREQSRAGGKFQATGSAIAGQIGTMSLDFPPTEFVRGSLHGSSRLMKVIHAQGSAEIGLILDKTPFYVESGGQISDTGTIAGLSFLFEVDDMTSYQGYSVHLGRLVRGDVREIEAYAANRSPVTAQVSSERRWDTMRNHTVTHLAHAALRKVLGEHIKQSGSYVGPDRMRFDFSHHQPLTADEIEQVERIVNEQILTAAPVETKVMSLDDAKKTGAMALFGEKYDDSVRVVSVDGFSKELCGGTHVDNAAQIGPFFITLETGIASGVRRLEAITGREAIRYMLEAKRFRQDVAAATSRQEKDALDAVRQLREQVGSLQKELKKTKAEMFAGGGQTVGSEENVGALTFIAHDFGETDRDVMAGWIDSQKQRQQPLLAIALGRVNGKYTYMAASNDSAFTQLKIDAGKLSQALLPQFGGRGGGKPTFAQGNVADDTSAPELFAAARSLLNKNGG